MKLSEINDPKLRQRITAQIAREDGARLPVAGLDAEKPEHQARQTLDGQSSGRQACANRADAGPAYAVTLVVCHQRVFDRDNLIGGCKPMRDAIAARLGCDDRDSLVEWNYEQVISKLGGTIVLIERR